MSYGVFRKRGKGWCSIEIDTPSGVTGHASMDGYMGDCYSSDKVGSYWMLVRGLERYQIGWDSHSDASLLKWLLSQKRTQSQRKIAYYSPGLGEHGRWIAFNDEEALGNALDATEASENDRERVLLTTFSGAYDSTYRYY